MHIDTLDLIDLICSTFKVLCSVVFPVCFFSWDLSVLTQEDYLLFL